MAKISVSFKKKEMYLYEYLQEQLDVAYYLKTLLLEDYKKNRNEKIESKKDIQENKNKKNINLNF
ncbi:hypothetical protein [Clostridium sp.]|uniref:hypothetical protein n=1 Tax=Clostridium sp. TaxID=1506 RepID=UPI003991F1C4